MDSKSLKPTKTQHTLDILDLLKAHALSLLHDQQTIGLPASLGLNRQTLHHIPGNTQIFNLYITILEVMSSWIFFQGIYNCGKITLETVLYYILAIA